VNEIQQTPHGFVLIFLPDVLKHLDVGITELSKVIDTQITFNKLNLICRRTRDLLTDRSTAQITILRSDRIRGTKRHRDKAVEKHGFVISCSKFPICEVDQFH
jgi:hypothetical protein